VLVAVTVTVPCEVGAVNSPLDAIIPALADQVTVELKLPVPCTDGVHCDVAPGAVVEGTQLTTTEPIVEDGGEGLGGLDCTVIVAVPDFEPSCILVAVIVTVSGEPGAVNSPLDPIIPALVDHVTAELKLPEPWTDAMHCDVAPGATVEGAQLTATDEIPDITEEDPAPLLPPPQEDIAIRPRKAIKTETALLPVFLLLFCRELSIDRRRAGFRPTDYVSIWMPARADWLSLRPILGEENFAVGSHISHSRIRCHPLSLNAIFWVTFPKRIWPNWF